MDLFGKVHTANEQLSTSGREGIAFSSRHKKPLTDDVSVQCFHPTTGARRSFLMTRSEVEELTEALTKWMAEGWAGFVDGAPGPRQNSEDTYETVTDARSVLDRLDARIADEAERRKRDEERHAGTYAGWTHDELVAELRVMKHNIDAANTRERQWREAMERDREQFRGQVRRLREVVHGKKTVSVTDLIAAVNEREEA
jgi:hypothetical protein